VSAAAGALGVLGVLALAGALLLALAAFGAFSSGRSEVARSLAAMGGIGSTRTPTAVRQVIGPAWRQRVSQPVMSALARTGHQLSPTAQTVRIRRRLDLAGNPSGFDVDRVLALKMLGLVGGGVLGAVAPLVLGGDALVATGGAIVGMVAGFELPTMALYQVAYNRTERLQVDLPDSLDLLTISVEAGLSFDAALAEVARNTTGPLAGEFFRVLQEMQIGVGRGVAIRSMGERTDLPELRQFAMAMVQADTLGIPIAAVLRVQAREMRIKRSQRAEEQAQKVPVKILFPLIFCILPTLFLFILGPAVITISKSLFGLGS
jgi:tight adherence protein C